MDYEWSLTTTEIELTDCKYYWEVELLSQDVGNMENAGQCSHNLFIGISRPNLDPTGCHFDRACTDGWFINASDGCLFGNGKDWECSDAPGPYFEGDRVGVLLDLDSGSLRFFKNGVEHGPGYPAGSVTGPVVAAVQMYHKRGAAEITWRAMTHPHGARSPRTVCLRQVNQARVCSRRNASCG
jgi:hypothetical protein